MPNGPKGQRRPADVIGNAVRVMQIGTGEFVDVPELSAKNAAAAELGRMGGAARARALSAKKKSAIAATAANARWTKKRQGRRGRAK